MKTDENNCLLMQRPFKYWTIVWFY